MPVDAKPETLDVVVVGAGFSGLYLLHRLRKDGFAVHVIEAGDDVGGTWYWNRYPGARCDIMSLDYSMSFDPQLQQEWHWPERYSAQPDILVYARHIAERFDLRRDISFGVKVTAATYDEGSDRWTVEGDDGRRWNARHVIMATGCLSVPRMPDVPGLEDFRGDWYHTGDWPHEGVDFTGKKVAVIGTGSSGIQSIPVIAQQAAELTVFQRTPNFSVPAWNGPMDPAFEAEHKAHYDELREVTRWSAGGYLVEDNNDPARHLPREEIEAELERRWQQGGFSLLGAYGDIMTDLEINAIVVDFVHGKIREKVKDPAVAELLCPKDHPFGTKRLCVDTGYYETYNRDNVSLVDIRKAPIETITPTGIRTAQAEHDFDVIVFATGFDAMTGAILNVDFKGRQGASLREKWAHGPRSYLGLMVSGFPNLFTVTGPQSPSVLANVITAIEQHVEWICDCINHMRDRQLSHIEARKDAEDKWVDHVIALGDATLYPQANSWYMGANIPGKPRVFMPYVGGCGTYRKVCDQVAAENYRGFELAS